MVSKPQGKNVVGKYVRIPSVPQQQHTCYHGSDYSGDETKGRITWLILKTSTTIRWGLNFIDQ